MLKFIWNELPVIITANGTCFNIIDYCKKIEQSVVRCYLFFTLWNVSAIQNWIFLRWTNSLKILKMVKCQQVDFKRIIHHQHWPAKTLVLRRLANQLEMLLQNSICRQKVPILKSDFSLVILKIFNPQIELFDFNGKINRCFVCSCKREHLNEPGNLFFEWKTELNFTAAKFKEDFFQRTLNFYFFHSPTPLWINAH